MSRETQKRTVGGIPMLALMILLEAGGIALFVVADSFDGTWVVGPLVLLGVLAMLAGFFLSMGLFMLQPGESRVCTLFGKYMGTSREEGLRWSNPLYSHAKKLKVSLRARTLTSDHLKVNDKKGNPIEIASVVVWRVEDTAKAVFDVDDFEEFVAMQSETALRHVASVYAYDRFEEDETESAAEEITLRSNVQEVSESLRKELDERLAPSGVTVDDARLTHLAYAPEIAQAMLRRQQADAIIAARRAIVEGAVSMVDLAVERLSASGTIELDDERKATMASNLMVVLCGGSEAQPVVNTGTLYS